MRTYEKIPFSNGDNIKSLSYYRRMFYEIEKVNFSSCQYEEIKFVVEKLFKVPVLQNLYQSHQFDHNFYRVRKVRDFQEDKTLPESFGAPPILCTKKGRANMAFYPVLYLSSLPQAACSESNLTKGEEIFLSLWAYSKRATNILNYVGERRFMHPSLDDITSNFEGQFATKFSCYKRHVSEALSFVRNRITSWFLQDDKYELSSFLGHYALYDTDLSSYDLSVDSIMYPCRKDGFKSFNLAVGPSGMPHVYPKTVIRGIFDMLTEKGLSIQPIEVGEYDGKTIVWQSANRFFTSRYPSSSVMQKLKNGLYGFKFSGSL